MEFDFKPKGHVREAIVDGETVHLKKDFLGWRVIEPIRDSDGKLNKLNLWFGGKRNLFNLLIYLIIISLMIFGVSEMVESCNDMAEHPCKYFDLSSCSYHGESYTAFVSDDNPINITITRIG